MIKLSIDGRDALVPEGTSLLQAARQLGVFIPTLCHVGGVPPSASCFLCAVEIEGRPALAPSCAMPVAEGMVVRTQSEELRSTRRLALELLLSDHTGDCVGPCRTGCPARLDIPGFLSLVSSGEPRRAAETVVDQLTLPASLGRICPRLCEERCRRAEQGEPLSIAGLHRFAADWDLASSKPYLPSRKPATGKRVAIVGAGPAGLSAAHHLLRRGHAVVLFDAHSEPGGMLRWGIPEFRLPRGVLAGEIEALRALGAEMRMGTRLGHDVTLEQLRRDYDVVFLAIGAQASREIDCPGGELAIPAIDLLRDVAGGERPVLAGHVAVVGGGNAAIDAARTALRLGAERVTVFYRRSRREMPCLTAEIEAAEAEGVRIETLLAPEKIERIAATSLRITCTRMTLGSTDESGRARAVPVPGAPIALEVGAVIAAIGQRVEVSALQGSGLDLSARGIAADPRTLATGLAGVFAGGDGVTGPDLAVRAVAAGRLAAISIGQYLEGRPVQGDPGMIDVVMGKLDESELAALLRDVESVPRTPMPMLPASVRARTFDEVELGYPAEAAERESSRCLQCGCFQAADCRLRQYATEYGADPLRFTGARRSFRRDASHAEVVYEPGKCILCGACVEVAAGQRPGLAIVGRGFEAAVAAPFGVTMREALDASVARGAAAACPTGAFSAGPRACFAGGTTPSPTRVEIYCRVPATSTKAS